jgi:nitrogen-specific signal transduction histidine kinase
MSMERGGERRSLVFESDHVVTEHKRLESTLRERAEELTVADRNKDTFLALLAHELRNPLGPLTSALAVLTHRDTSPAMAERAEAIMSRQIRNMSRMIDDLLDVSRMTQGRIELIKERVAMTTLVERALDGSRHHMDARDQAVTLSLPPEEVDLEVDPLRIEQVLGNLLNNASKFSTRGSQIILTVEAPTAIMDAVVIRVRDTGIGIAAEKLPLVFELFMQADPALNRATGGLGIGLSLVRHLVELHGGSVAASSGGIGKGSEFVVRLPVHVEGPAEKRDPPRGETTRPPTASRRIVVTDDNIDGAETLAMILRMVGHDVRVTHDGPSTVEIATTFEPEVIFLDVFRNRAAGGDIGAIGVHRQDDHAHFWELTRDARGRGDARHEPMDVRRRTPRAVPHGGVAPGDALASRSLSAYLVYRLGDPAIQKKAATFSGISIPRVRVQTLVMVGVLCGISGMLGLAFFLLRVLKATLIALQFKHKAEEGRLAPD